MSNVQKRSDNSLTTRPHEPLIAVPMEDGGVRYFTSRDDADAAGEQDAVQKAIDLAGAWSGLDADEMFAALDRIRHESTPTPPITSIGGSQGNDVLARGEGYVTRPSSHALPGVTADALTSLLPNSMGVGDIAWMRSVRAWVRTLPVPGTPS